MTALNFDRKLQPVRGTRGICASSQPEASRIGVAILNAGGNAADAAIGMAAALNVTEPCSTGLGGDVFVLYYRASDKKLLALNGSGRSPVQLTLEKVNASGFADHLPPAHAFNVTVPGACAAWCDLQEAVGRLSMEQILSPAMELANRGFPVQPVTSHFWSRGVEHLLPVHPSIAAFSIDGRGPEPYQHFRNPDLANTLQSIIDGGKSTFYTGRIAESIVHAVKDAGGCLSLDDLASHTSTWVDPIGIEYNGINVWECPPNGQGIAALIALNILRNFDLRLLPSKSASLLHLQIEAMKLAFADAHRYVADPEFAAIPMDQLLSRAYAAERSRLIDPSRANPSVQHGTPISTSDTVYFCVVDAEGNACSFIASNYMGFGTGIVPQGCGFSLQNRGNNFSLDPGSWNVLAPRKRPYHTIIPGMLTNADGTLLGPFGVMGGFMQPQGHLQVVSALTDSGLGVQEALDLPRFCIEPRSAPVSVDLESGIPENVMQDLAAMGHTVRPVSGTGRAVFGRGQLILKQSDGSLIAGSDPRADGCALAQ